MHNHYYYEVSSRVYKEGEEDYQTAYMLRVTAVCTVVDHPGYTVYSSLHAVTIVSPNTCSRATSDVHCGSEPCQSQCACTYNYACDDHYLARSKFNSLLTEMITPQTYIHTSIII